MAGSRTPAEKWAVQGAESAAPRITEGNAANIPLEEWNRQFRAAEARGDVEEGQRLWDLWFSMKAPNTQMKGVFYRSERGRKPFNSFDETMFGTNGARMGKGVYLFNDELATTNYGDDVRKFYVNAENVAEDMPGPKLFGMPDAIISRFKNHKVPGLRAAAENVEGADAIHGIDESWGRPLDEWAVRHGTQVKSAEPFTYADDGSLIDITDRANFSKPDVRYAFEPGSDFAPTRYDFTDFNDVDISLSSLPDYAKNPSRENLINASEIFDERFNYRDWIERMEGRKLTDEEFETLRAKYPRDIKIIRDKKDWSDSVVPSDTPNEVHIGKKGTQDPEIEGTITAHEKDHAHGIYNFTEDQLTEMFGKISSSYLKKGGGAEMFARLGQIANWFGIRNIGKQPLTGEMLKYAAAKGRYVKDANMSNNMYEFFQTLKANNSWDKAAAAFNKYGKSLVLPIAVVGTTVGLSKNKEK